MNVKYRHLLAYDQMMQSSDVWIADMQVLAEKENAPVDAIYRTSHGVWICFGDVENPIIRENINNRLEFMP